MDKWHPCVPVLTAAFHQLCAPVVGPGCCETTNSCAIYSQQLIAIKTAVIKVQKKLCIVQCVPPHQEWGPTQGASVPLPSIPTPEPHDRHANGIIHSGPVRTPLQQETCKQLCVAPAAAPHHDRGRQGHKGLSTMQARRLWNAPPEHHVHPPTSCHATTASNKTA